MCSNHLATKVLLKWLKKKKKKINLVQLSIVIFLPIKNRAAAISWLID